MKFNNNLNMLRGICVILVTLFHMDIPGFEYGYLGVDIFFLISGYLMTQLYFESNTFGLLGTKDFYASRIIRIIPTMLLTIIAVLIYEFFYSYPGDLLRVINSAKSSLESIQNISLSKQAGYFNPEIRYNPLLHLWSLSVEIQFYIIVPLIGYALHLFKYRSKVVYCSLIALFVYTLTSKDNQNHIFYLLQFRLWEFFLGIAFYYNKERMRRIAVTIESLPIIKKVVLLLSSLIVAAALTGPPDLTIINRTILCLLISGIFISSEIKTIDFKAINYLGRISYALYMWHYPIIIAFIGFYPEKFTILNSAIYFSLLIALSHITTINLEEKIRKSNKTNLVSIIVLTAWAITYLAVYFLINYGSTYIYQINNRAEVLEDKYKALVLPSNPYEPKCKDFFVTNNANIQICEFGDTSSKVTVGVYGDSHAGMLLGPLNDEFIKMKIRGVRFKLDACEPIPRIININVRNPRGTALACEAQVNTLQRYLEKNVDALIVASRWTNHLFPIPGIIEQIEFDNREGGKEFHEKKYYYGYDLVEDKFINTLEYKKQAINDFFVILRHSVKNVIVVYPVPEAGWDLPRYNYSQYLKHGDFIKNITTSEELYNSRNKFAIESFDYLHTNGIITPIRPSKIFCSTFIPNRCAHQFNYTSFYSDDDHLSYQGAYLIVKEVIREIR